MSSSELRRYLGLDRPVYVRYGLWVWGLMRGDLGRSFSAIDDTLAQQVSVKQVIEDKLWLTVALTGFTILVTWTFAIPVGIYSAVRQHSVGDYAFTLLGFTGLAVPDFLLGLVLMYVAFAYFQQSVGGLFSTPTRRGTRPRSMTWSSISGFRRPFWARREPPA